jgi:hypothetical protein
MLLSVRSRTRREQFIVHMPDNSAQDLASCNVVVEKFKIDSSMQMLHENESCLLSSSENGSIRIKNVGKNQFSVYFSRLVDGQMQAVCEGQVSAQGVSWRPMGSLHTQCAPHASVVSVLNYTRRQMIPEYSTAASVAQKMQTTYGTVALGTSMPRFKWSIDNAFFRTNACTISKLNDMLNQTQGRRLVSPAVAANLVWLAAVFCATASSQKTSSLFNVSQMQMTDLSEKDTKEIQLQAPEKQHLTMLIRGDNAEDRIKRFNIAVRIFATDSGFVRDVLPRIGGLNTEIYSPALVVSGVRNGQAAAIFLSSDSLTSDVHSLAIQTFLSGT